MIKFFRKIRYNLMSENKIGKYLKYAIGEIILVVIGILIALQINNWNENRKDQQVVKELYHNLISSLKTDSIAVVNIDSLIQCSLKRQELVLTSQPNELLIRYSNEELKGIVRDIWRGVYSFYPQMGIYNQILSSNLMKLIPSKEIKDGLRKYYDFTCTRVKVIDPIINDRYHIYFQNFISEEIGMIVSDPLYEKIPPPEFTLEKLELLKMETINLYDLTYAVSSIFIDVKNDINSLLQLISSEIN